MNNRILSPQPLWQSNGLAMLRIITGLLMAYHGCEVCDSAKMSEYAKWDVIKTLPAPAFMAYLGKGLELVSGVSFVLGLFTRISALFMAINMLFICFKIGNGKFYYDDQHPVSFCDVGNGFLFHRARKMEYRPAHL